MLEDKAVKLFEQAANDLKEAQHNIKTKNAELSERILDLEQKQAMYGGGNGNVASSRPTLGSALVATDEFKSGAFDALRKTRGTLTVDLKYITLTGSGVDTTPGGPLAPPDRTTLPELSPWRKFVIADLVDLRTTTAGHVQYPRQVTASRDNQAAWKSEGEAHSYSSMDFDLVDVKVNTIGHLAKMSVECLADAPGLLAVCDNELAQGIRYVEDASYCTGDGTGNNPEGIYTAATAYAGSYVHSADNAIDKLGHAIEELLDRNFVATGIVMNAHDLQRLATLKDSQNRYLGNGPFGPAPNRIFGLPVAATLALDSGKWIVGDFTKATLWRRQGIEIAISLENSDDFEKGLCTVKATMRSAFAVRRGEAFTRGTSL